MAGVSGMDASGSRPQQQYANRLRPFDSKTRPTSTRGHDDDDNRHPDNARFRSALNDSAARPATAASQYHQQAAGIGQGRAESREHSTSSWTADRSSSDRLSTAQDHSPAAAGVSNRHRLKQQEHQHELPQPSARLQSGSELGSSQARSSRVPEAKPYATEQSLKVAQCAGSVHNSQQQALCFRHCSSCVATYEAGSYFARRVS